MNFWQLVRIIKSRLWLIVGIVAFTLLVTFIAAPKPRVVYQASADVTPTAQVLAGGATTATDKTNNSKDRDRILSDLMVLAMSSNVFNRAKDFLAMPVEEQKELEPGLPRYKQITRLTMHGDPKEKQISYSEWQDVLEVHPVINPMIGDKGTTTDIIRISAKLPEGTYSPFIANAVAVSFAQAYQDKSREDARKNVKFLENSKEDARKTVRELQSKIADYKQDNDISTIQAEQENAARIAALETQRSEAAAAAQEANAALADINGQLAREPRVRQEVMPGDMNPTVAKLKEELLEAESNFRLMKQKYGPSHDKYKAAQARISEIKNQIDTESSNYRPPRVNQVYEDLKAKRAQAKYTAAQANARLSSIEADLAEAKEKNRIITQTQPELAEMLMEYAQAENTYRMIAEQYALATIAEKEFTKTGSIIPLDWAYEASNAIVEGPTREKLLGYGFLLSLIIGVMLAIWLDSIDNRMRNAADVEKLMELPVVGLTPKLSGGDGGNLPKLTHIYPLSAMAESYRILRTNLLFALRDNPFKTLMVATGRPGQGATTTISNLAIALAQIGKKVILIDADMRRPSLHKFFNVPNESGLSTLLQGKGELSTAFQKTDVDNLIVVPAGPQPLNPSELLGSDRMKDLVERLEEHCDLVLFDTPSTIVFSDGPMLASWIDAVLMVVSANQVPRGTERQVRDLLKKANANIIGVAVNRMSAESIDSCYYYGHYYSDSVPDRSAGMLGPGGNGKTGLAPHEEDEGGDKTAPLAAGEKKEEDDNPFPD